jgi:voltage-gated potassium channel
VTVEGRIFAFFLALYGFAVFGYATATLASFFIGRDTEKDTKTALSQSNAVEELKQKLDRIESTLKNLARNGKRNEKL